MLASSPGNRGTFSCAPGKVTAVLLAFGAIGNLANAGISFQDPVNVPLPDGSFPEALAVGHFKGDNVWDLAVVNDGANTATILLGNADGTFETSNSYNVGTHPAYVTAADLNGDGILDLVVSNWDSADLNILLGVGDGSFTDAGNYALSDHPFSTVVADFNSDGFADIVVTTTVSTFMLLGYGDGTFGGPAELPFGPSARFVALGDFNGDGIPDLAVTKARGVDMITIETGNGDGTFQRVGDYAVG